MITTAFVAFASEAALFSKLVKITLNEARKFVESFDEDEKIVEVETTLDEG